ncbi:MAG: hypothetical protein U1F71_18415 [Verrucomicrobiaceae bacterium]
MSTNHLPYYHQIEEIVAGIVDANAVFDDMPNDWSMLFHHDLQQELRKAIQDLGPLSVIRRHRLVRIYNLSKARCMVPM